MHASEILELYAAEYMIFASTIYRVAQKECNTYTINNVKKMRDRMKKLCALLRIKKYHSKMDTKIVNFDEGVSNDSMAVYLRQCNFQDLPFHLKSHNLRTEIFHCLASRVL